MTPAFASSARSMQLDRRARSNTFIYQKIFRLPRRIVDDRYDQTGWNLTLCA
jgi:hypothetical protein